MTRHALQILAQLHAALSEHIRDGRLSSPLPPAPRDGYAALYLWSRAGQPVERLRPDDIALIPPTLRLDTAPLARPAVGYTLLDRSHWIVVARLPARAPIEVAPGIAYAYPDPMILYCGSRRNIRTGAINLAHTPTVTGLRLSPGHNYGELGRSALTADDADDDLLALGLCLPRFYGLIP